MMMVVKGGGKGASSQTGHGGEVEGWGVGKGVSAMHWGVGRGDRGAWTRGGGGRTEVDRRRKEVGEEGGVT